MFEILDKKNCKAIFNASFRILSEIGVRIDDEDSAAMLADSGCRAGTDGRVRFPEEVIRKTIETVPEEVVVYDADGRPAVRAAAGQDGAGQDGAGRAGRLYLAAGLNCIDFYDAELKKRRTGLLADVEKAAAVCDGLQRIDMAAALCTPSDVKPEIQAVEAVRAVVRHTRKPVAFTAHDERGAEEVWRLLAAEAGGMDALTQKPRGLDLTGPTSPLRIGSEALRRLRFAARHRLPVVCYPGIIPGAASPVTLSGTLAQSGAEILAGIAVHQLENPGAPVLSGSAVLPMDMSCGSITYGSPEYAKACTAAVDFFSFLGIPAWSGGGCSDSASPDAQAAAEAQLTMGAAASSGASLIHNAGYLASGRCGSLEMLVLADELIRINESLLSAPDCLEDAIGLELIREAAEAKASGGSMEFMASDHTISRMRSEMYYSDIFKRGAGGSLDIWEAVSERLKRLL